MKLNIKLLFLLSTSTVLATSIQEKLNKRLDIDSVTKCLNALDKFEECKLDIKNLQIDKDSLCNTFNSENCQKIIKGGINSIPECKDIPQGILVSTPLVFGMVSSAIGLACSKDEEGKYCPLSDVIVRTNGILNKDDEAVKMAVENTCKSKKCVDAAVDTLSKIEAGELLATIVGSSFKTQVLTDTGTSKDKEINEKDYKEVLEYFKSENCTLKYSAALNAETSDATIYRISGALLVIFTVLLPYFLNP